MFRRGAPIELDASFFIPNLSAVVCHKRSDYSKFIYDQCNIDLEILQNYIVLT